MCDEYNPSDEFKALRDELLQGQKYVFERPLLIITVSIAILNFIEEPYVTLLPPIVIGLLTFNLWFTVNRMRSLARIAAYIQLEIEEKAYRPWLGWETCLRYYRKWTRLDASCVRSWHANEMGTHRRDAPGTRCRDDSGTQMERNLSPRLGRHLPHGTHLERK